VLVGVALPPVEVELEAVELEPVELAPVEPEATAAPAEPTLTVVDEPPSAAALGVLLDAEPEPETPFDADVEVGVEEPDAAAPASLAVDPAATVIGASAD
jgi:hypothetical protein